MEAMAINAGLSVCFPPSVFTYSFHANHNLVMTSERLNELASQLISMQRDKPEADQLEAARSILALAIREERYPLEALLEEAEQQQAISEPPFYP